MSYSTKGATNASADPTQRKASPRRPPPTAAARPPSAKTDGHCAEPPRRNASPSKPPIISRPRFKMRPHPASKRFQAPGVVAKRLDRRPHAAEYSRAAAKAAHLVPSRRDPVQAALNTLRPFMLRPSAPCAPVAPPARRYSVSRSSGLTLRRETRERAQQACKRVRPTCSSLHCVASAARARFARQAQPHQSGAARQLRSHAERQVRPRAARSMTKPSRSWSRVLESLASALCAARGSSRSAATASRLPPPGGETGPGWAAAQLAAVSISPPSPSPPRASLPFWASSTLLRQEIDAHYEQARSPRKVIDPGFAMHRFPGMVRSI